MTDTARAQEDSPKRLPAFRATRAKPWEALSSSIPCRWPVSPSTGVATTGCQVQEQSNLASLPRPRPEASRRAVKGRRRSLREVDAEPHARPHGAGGDARQN